MQIRSAEAQRDEAQGQAQQHATEAAEVRKRIAELEGALSVSASDQARTCTACRLISP